MVSEVPGRPALQGPPRVVRGIFPDPARWAAATIALALVYFAVGSASLPLASVNPSVTPVWPPTGIALAALLLLGRSVWPGVLLGAFLANVTTAATPAAALGIAVGNSLEALVGATLVDRFAGGRRLFEGPREVLVFAALGGGLATTLSATTGATTLAVSGLARWSDFTAIWLTWWLGDLSGALLATPLLVLWVQSPRLAWDRRRAAEAAALLAALLATGGLIFGAGPPLAASGRPFTYLTLPVVLWAALRFGPRETATVTVTLAAMALMGTLAGSGPFTGPYSANTSLLLLQTFMGAISIIGLLVASVSWRLRLSQAEAHRLGADMASLVEARTRELQEATAELERAQAVAHVGSWISDLGPDQRLEWSPETYRIFGLDEARFGHHVDDFFARVHPDDVAAVSEAVRAALEEHAPYAIDHRILRPDGSVRWVHEQAEIVRDRDGRAVRLIGTVQDITERKQLQDQLAQSQKMEAVGRLAGGIAHDFNNLLGVISGYSELALRDLAPGHRARGRVEEIQRAAERAATLTRQLLAFSRKQVLQPKVVDANRIVSGMEGMLRRLIGEDVTLVADLQPGLWLVRADPTQLEQVLLNLAVNARDAMPRGGRLTLETANVTLDEAFAQAHRGATPGPHVLIAVTDTGHGMDARTLSHVFEPFFTTKPVGRGTGLGLAMIYGIVKQSGGYVTVRSELGRGARFEVFLPRVEESRAEPALAGEPALPASGSETILLVEDDASLRRVVREILESAGYTVLESGGPDDALAASMRHPNPIHLVLTDVVMPGGSGTRLADELGTIQPAIRVVYMSGYTDDALSHHGSLAPGTHLLQKPFSADTLLNSIRRALDDDGRHGSC